VIAASAMPTIVISAPVAHQGRAVTNAFDAPTAKWAMVLMMKDAMTAGQADGEEERDDRDEAADGRRHCRRQRRAPRIGKVFFRETQLFLHQGLEKLFRLLVNPLGHGA